MVQERRQRNVRLAVTLDDRLLEQARQRLMTVNEAVEEAVIQWLDRPPPKFSGPVGRYCSHPPAARFRDEEGRIHCSDCSRVLA